MANREIDIKNQDYISSWQLRDIKSDCLVVVLFASFIAFLRPFGMDNIVYWYAWSFWVVTCLVGYVIYSPVIYFLERSIGENLSRCLPSPWWRLVLSAVIASFIMSLVVPFIIALFFDIDEGYWPTVLSSIAPSFAIGGVTTALGAVKTYILQQKEVLSAQQQLLSETQSQVVSTKNEKVEAFLAKLPLEKRGELLCLQMDDHYLHVHTDKGSHMILMRFKDALESVGDDIGFQTHRSWWVAQDAIVSDKKVGRKTMLVLKNELEVPVSQTYLPKVKEALNL